MSNTAENKRIVLEGLQRRNDRLDAFENDMIKACNQNNAEAREQREKNAENQTALAVYDEERKARARARLKALQEAHRRERAVSRAVNVYLATDVGLLLLAAGTKFPFWASITMSLGLLVILAVHLYRIYVPLEQETKKDNHKS